jgi:hypothetical protein
MGSGDENVRQRRQGGKFPRAWHYQNLEAHSLYPDRRQNCVLDISPFMSAQLALDTTGWLKQEIDKMESYMVGPEEAMHSLTREINNRIRQNLERKPRFQSKYEEITGLAYSPDWWRSRDN